MVDWRSSVIREASAFGRANGIDADWQAFADAWRGKYGPFMDKVRTGALPWTNLDGLHRLALEELLAEFGIEGVSDAAKAELNLAWHRLDPWPDAPAGLARLKARFIVAAMSNGNIALMTNLARYAGLPWDCILGAELARAYKPDPQTYLTGVELLGLQPAEAMMVAAHPGDLQAAAALGLKTALVSRPLERGPAAAPERGPTGSFDVVATDFRDLAARLAG
jgi:2-haloacid dehalogenase